MKKNKFCIVIPIYKKELDCTENLSLDRLIKQIEGKKYKVYLVKPESLDCTNYHKLINNRIKVENICFNDDYFKDIHGYSQLCLNYEFYNKFSSFEYIYIYQLDCYLLNDNLEFWTQFDYDYIGGPILSTGAGWDTLDKKTNKWEPKVGNGGFSLRKISTFKELTDPNGEFRNHYKITDDILSKVIYEDKYFCNDLYKYYDLVMPNWEEASKFSWDMNVDLYNKFFKIEYLPMCAHAWTRNIRFWKDKFSELIEDPSIVEFCEKKYEELFKLYYNENNETIKYC